VIGQPFRLLVTGSRTWHDARVIEQALAVIMDRHPEGVLLVHGACPRGADAIAAAYADRNAATAPRPNLRVIEALATTVPLFLLPFAWAYFTMSNTAAANFSTHLLTRTDALYFTATVFSTVGFGGITAASQSARLVVTAQMLLDLLALGLVVRAFVGAVQLARQQAGPPDGPGGPPGQTRQQGDDTP
jgi:hypothetical protein